VTEIQRAEAEARPGAVRVVASAALVITGLLTAGYGALALGAARADVIGPAVIITAVGLLGLRWPVLLWLGPVPLALHLTLSAPTLAYDLARPAQLSYAVPSALVLVAATVAAASTCTYRQAAIPTSGFRPVGLSRRRSGAASAITKCWDARHRYPAMMVVEAVER
jgi:hypothetical protein